jgi:hypothetical protein
MPFPSGLGYSVIEKVQIKSLNFSNGIILKVGYLQNDLKGCKDLVLYESENPKI